MSNKPTLENYRLIPGFEGYAVTTHGSVFSYLSDKWLKPSLSRQGYYMVSLRKDAGYYRTSVHRLVALAYVDNPDSKPQVNHIDGNKLNNHVDNLEWCTQAENQQHANRTGLFANRARGERARSAALTVDDVKTLRQRHKAGEDWNVIALDYPQVKIDAIKRAIRGRTWSHV